MVELQLPKKKRCQKWMAENEFNEPPPPPPPPKKQTTKTKNQSITNKLTQQRTT
jgi:hypothetical protein